MATALVTTAATKNLLKPKCMSFPKDQSQTLGRSVKPTSIHRLPKPPKSLNRLKLVDNPKLGLASAVLSTMVSSSDPALAVQKVADTAEGDNRFLVLVLPIVIAVSWVLYNILGPALNQIERMRSEKGIIVGLGLGGLLASNFLSGAEALAAEIAMIGEALDDNQSSLQLVFIATALTWVLYKSLLQPALCQNQEGELRLTLPHKTQ